MVDEINFTPFRPIEPREPTTPGSGARPVPGEPKVGEKSFQEVLKGTLKEIDDLQFQASERIRDSFDPTNPVDLHEVMLAVEEANISFQFVMQVRNRLMDAYNEILRMQV